MHFTGAAVEKKKYILEHNLPDVMFNVTRVKISTHS